MSSSRARAVVGVLRRTATKAFVLTAYLLWLSACVTPMHEDQLFLDLGGIDGITEITDGFLYHLSQDERVIDFWAESDIDRFHQKVIEHICHLSGGPCEYTGDDMVLTHTGMAINETHFNAVVQDLILSMDDTNVPTTTQNRLLKILAAFHDEIVGQ